MDFHPADDADATYTAYCNMLICAAKNIPRGFNKHYNYKEIKSINDAQNLQLDLDAACRWEKDLIMHFHPDKCNLISNTQARKPIHFTYNKLHDHPLAEVEHSKYLGITLQSNLEET